MSPSGSPPMTAPVTTPVVASGFQRLPTRRARALVGTDVHPSPAPPPLPPRPSATVTVKLSVAVVDGVALTIEALWRVPDAGEYVNSPVEPR